MNRFMVHTIIISKNILNYITQTFYYSSLLPLYMWWYILLSVVSFCLLLYAIIAICNKLLVWILWYWNHPHPSNDFRREDSIIIMRTIIRCGLLLFFESENSVILLLLLLLLLTNHKKLLTCKWLQHCPSLNHYSTISASNTGEIAYLSCDELVE